MNIRSSLIICSLGLVSLLGCGNSEPRFSHREEFHQLEPFARDYVAEVLNTYFGTPVDSVAWERLPLEYHYTTAVVAGEPTERKVQLTLTEEHPSIGPGTEIAFTSGNLDGKGTGWIRDWDPSSGTAVLETRLVTAPAAGDEVLVGPGAVLKNGRYLYAQHCQHCHGVSGDGAGPTAAYLNPRPRDYRLGKFKFTTTKYEYRAQRGDLHRVIREGIPGTYMPSFKLLKPEEMQAITEYVMWLSMRGEVEYRLTEMLKEFSHEYVAQRVADGEKYEDIRQTFLDRAASGELKEGFDDAVSGIVDAWKDSQTEEALVQVATKRIPSSPESIARGRQLYLDANNKCSQCHGDAGFGDGPQTLAVMQGKEVPGLFDDWGNPVKPRNLHTGIYRGGRRPYDLFCRIRAAVKGTPMPRFDSMPEEDVWHLVNYVYSVPFEEVKAGAGKAEQAAAPAEQEHPPAAEPDKEVAVN